jgi:hypothetical protein
MQEHSDVQFETNIAILLEQMKPSSYPAELHSWSLSETANSMAQLPFVACPDGSIPILQDRKDGKIDISNFHPMANVGKGEVRL